MPSLHFGLSVIPDGVGLTDGRADPDFTGELDLTTGREVVGQDVPIPASTAVGSPVTLWQSSAHGVSATSAAVDFLCTQVDPGRLLDDANTIGIRPVYTRTGSTSTVNGAAFEKCSRDHPPKEWAVEVVDGTGVMFLTKLEGYNPSTTDAVSVRTKGWK